MRYALIFACVAIVGFVGVRIYEHRTGTSVLVSQGGKIWIPIDSDTPFVSESVRLALSDAGPAKPSAARWREIKPGFESGELDAVVDGKVADTLHLLRIDPVRFRFALHVDRTAHRDLAGWLRSTGAAAIVNGSYYDRLGGPATPSVIDGRPAGPQEYTASHGAFIASAEGARLVDTETVSWIDAFAGADTAFVSYPLLLDAAGGHRVTSGSGWLANRSFIAEDKGGHIIIGTSADAFFTLSALADFLAASPLDLKLALNLDGGPVACQGVRLDGVARDIYGVWEVQRTGDSAKMLPPLSAVKKAPMPIVIAVYPRS